MRHTRSQTNSRRSHHALMAPALSKDPAGNSYMRHRLSPVTGAYRERKVLDTGAKALKKAKKMKGAEAR